MLWLDTYRPELAVQDPALQRRFQEGNEVGDLAMGLLGDFVETTAYTADGKLDIAAMLKNTQKYIAEGKENICEAAFTKNGCYCAVDILHKTDGGYEIYEVKSSTDIYDVYLWDVAYQRWVLEQSGLKIVHTYIVYINNKYETAIHKKTLKDNGVKVLSAMENIPETPEGIILESLLEGMNQYFSPSSRRRYAGACVKRD